MQYVALIGCFLLVCMGCTDDKSYQKQVANLPEKKTSEPENCIQAPDSIQQNTVGCLTDGGMLVKQLNQTTFLIVKANFQRMSNHQCYHFDLSKDSVQVYIERYKTDYLIPYYCSDVVLTNAEKPMRFKAVSGKLTIQDTKDGISALLENGTFRSNKKRADYYLQRSVFWHMQVGIRG